ncbi:putative membrane protein [Nocardia nova SH22a]|uniref:Putative membrane protein n=1 Tax=Nocardia nova SH22a TaxID=1415166 RepID=W5TSJ2_9NOCA|nr:hypothetical protein [Nocardia nova]AHH20181.1 putative membrane protein [Nocardia nova SH22a]
MTSDSADGRGRARRAVLVAVWIALAVVGASTRPFGAAATGLVAGATVFALVCAVRAGVLDIPSTRWLRRGVVIWGALLAAVLIWELFAWLGQPALLVPDPAHPTLSTLLSPWLDGGSGRFAGWLVWLAAGWWLVRP